MVTLCILLLAGCSGPYVPTSGLEPVFWVEGEGDSTHFSTTLEGFLEYLDGRMSEKGYPAASELEVEIQSGAEEAALYSDLYPIKPMTTYVIGYGAYLTVMESEGYLTYINVFGRTDWMDRKTQDEYLYYVSCILEALSPNAGTLYVKMSIGNSRITASSETEGAIDYSYIAGQGMMWFQATPTDIN